MNESEIITKNIGYKLHEELFQTIELFDFSNGCDEEYLRKILFFALIFDFLVSGIYF